MIMRSESGNEGDGKETIGFDDDFGYGYDTI
jgi:hypothetical protein